MKAIRKFGTAVLVASLMATGFGTTLSAASKKPGNGHAAICAYLAAIIAYPGVNETILTYALSLYAKYDCAAQ